MIAFFHAAVLNFLASLYKSVNVLHPKTFKQKTTVQKKTDSFLLGSVGR